MPTEKPVELIPEGTGAEAPSPRKKNSTKAAVVEAKPANGHLAVIEGLEGTVARLSAANKALDTLVRDLVPENEIIWVENRQGQRKPVLDRSNYAKLFRGLCLTEADEPVIEKSELGRGEFLYECTTYVETPWGTRAYGVGVAATDEIATHTKAGPIPMGRRIHDAKARAHTRAWERAIANLIGLGVLGESEVEGSMDLSAADQPIQFIAGLAERKGITAQELDAYCQARFGGGLTRLDRKHIPTLKAAVEAAASREEFAKDGDYWKAMLKNGT